MRESFEVYLVGIELACSCRTPHIPHVRERLGLYYGRTNAVVFCPGVAGKSPEKEVVLNTKTPNILGGQPDKLVGWAEEIVG